MGSTTKTLVMSVKIMLMSIGILTTGILLSSLSSSIPTTSSDLPSLFSTLRSWLRPPYLYFLINAIIATIAFLHHNHHHHHHHDHHAPPPSKPTMMTSLYHHDNHHHHHSNSHDVISFRTDHVQYTPYDVVSVTDNSHNNVVEGGGMKSLYDYNDVVSVKDVEVEVVGKFADVDNDKRETIVVDHDDVHVDESTVVDPSTWTAPPPLMRQGALKKFSPERPPACSRFSQHRRPSKGAPAEGGKALRVHKPKKHDTLESTWKAITEGRHVPLNRHLKKSDTWENHPRQIDLLDDSSPFPATAVKKSETFKERTNYMTPPVAPSRLRKEPSLGHDELNRRVEAFINKFNEDMRLQRQESMQQFMEMINRAA